MLIHSGGLGTLGGVFVVKGIETGLLHSFVFLLESRRVSERRRRIA